MKRKYFLILFFFLAWVIKAEIMPDFMVKNILVNENGFIAVQLANLSPVDCTITPNLDEKIFIILSINEVKRAEYKIKQIDRKIFGRQSLIVFKTHFLHSQTVNIRIELNPHHVIQETNYSNNTINKTL